MAVKVTVNSSSPNRVSINNQQRTTVRAVDVDNSPNRVSINNQQRTTIRTVAVTGSDINAIDTLAELLDVVATDPNENETLVYDETLQKYVIKILPSVDGGTF